MTKAPFVGKLTMRRVTRPLTISLVFAFTGQSILVCSGVLAARLLGVHERGILAVTVAAPYAIGMVTAFGGPAALSYAVARCHGLTPPVATQARRLAGRQAVAATLLSMITLGGMGAAMDVPTAAAVAAVATAPLIVIHQYMTAALQGAHSFLAFNLTRQLPALASVVFVLPFAEIGRANVVLFLYSLLAAILVSTGISARLLARVPAGDSDVDLEPLSRFASRAGLGSTSLSEAARLDQFLVAFFYGPAVLGLYVVALSLTNLPRFMAQNIGAVAFPLIARNVNVGRTNVGFRFVVLALIGSASLAVPLIVMARHLIPFFFGEEFADARRAAQIALLAVVVYSGRRVLSDVLRGAGRPGLSSVSEVSVCAALLIAMPLLSAFGATGAAAGLLVAQVVGVGSLLIARQRNHMRGVKLAERRGEVHAPPA